MIHKNSKVILVSGISSGFGLEMARRLSQDGHVVYGTVRRQVEQLPGVNYLMADVTDSEQVSAAVNEVVRREGRIDVLVNNAGMGIGGPIEFTSADDAHRQMETNFFGLVNFVKAVLPVMRGQGSGRIIAVSSIGGIMGLPFQGFYSASKFAMEGYCQALRLETLGMGIDVVLVEPGDFSTGFTAARKKIDPAVAKAYPKYQKSMQGIEKDETTGLKPAFLAKKISSIVACGHPAHKCVVASPLQKLAVFAQWLLPSKAFAWVLSLYYGVR